MVPVTGPKHRPPHAEFGSGRGFLAGRRRGVRGRVGVGAWRAGGAGGGWLVVGWRAGGASVFPAGRALPDRERQEAGLFPQRPPNATKAGPGQRRSAHTSLDSLSYGRGGGEELEQKFSQATGEELIPMYLCDWQTKKQRLVSCFFFSVCPSKTRKVQVASLYPLFPGQVARTVLDL
jgi:hypothetical protein